MVLTAHSASEELTAERNRVRLERINLLEREAERTGEGDVLKQFSLNYLKCLVEEEHGDVSTYEHMVGLLKRSIAVREELQTLERQMDKRYFVKRVTSGFVARSGKHRETGGAVYWMRFGDFNRSAWRLKVGSAKAKAYVRAHVWMMETIHVQHAQDPDEKCVCFVDMDIGMLDFNPALVKEALRLMNDLFPVMDYMVLYYFGVPRVVPWFFNMVTDTLIRNSGNVHMCDNYEDAVLMVTDTSEVPDFWLVEDASLDRYAIDRTSTWCYERCLSEGDRVTTQDLFKPCPWPYAKQTESTGMVRRRTSKQLPMIIENDGE